MARPKITREDFYANHAAERLARKTVLVPFSDCHYFTGASNEHGYGLVNVAGRLEKAHRVAYEVAHGPISEGTGHHGTVVLHKCDEPSCVNPDHLRVGTQAENMADKIAKRRQYRGERHHYRKLTDAQILEIKARLRGAESQSAIARDYGVQQSLISMIKSGNYHSLVVAKAA